jgi:DNA modification methylase
MKKGMRKTRTSGVDDNVGSRLEVVYRPIAELKLDPKNPRTHSQHQIDQIACSIQAFGFCVPVLIDRHGRVIAGHGRVLACQQLGWREVPTICLEHLTEAQARAFMLADNKLTENSSWDEQLLGEQLKFLAEVDLDFSLEATGFELAEIDMWIEGLASAPDGKEDPADAVPETTEGPPVSQTGDLWILGPHRLVCGNALEEACYHVLMNRKRAAMVITDVPYNVPIEGHVSGNGRVRHKDFMMASGEMSEAEFTSFLLKACTLLARYSMEGSIHFLHMDWRHLQELLAAGRQVYSELKNVCVWVKDNAGLGSFYRSQHELILVYKKGTAAHHNNIQLGRFGRSRSNIWRYPGANSFARSTEEGNLLALHPTVKPVALVADAIMDASGRGDLVLDAFLGSGTTVIAAERTGRICYGIEIDPRYVDTAIRRWQTWTGQKARHAISGCLFDDREAAKGGTHHAQ